MKRRFRLLGSCFTGCAIASLAGLWLMLAFDAPMLAALAAAIVPCAACWLAGLRDPKQLAKISVYAFIGWALTFGLQPAVAQSAASHAARISGLPLVGREWHIPATIVSTLLALIGTAFAPLANSTSNELPAA